MRRTYCYSCLCVLFEIMSDFEGDSDVIGSEYSEEDLKTQLKEPRKKNFNYLEETVPQYDETLFFEHFRISREVVDSIIQKYEISDQHKPQSGQYGKLSSESQVLIFLWFIGHQTASFRDVADRFDITLSSLHRIIKRVSVFLSNLSPQVITWPTETEKTVIEQHFRENGFCGIIGAIGGFHVEIDKPEIDPDSYINRMGHFSIQMQAVCDHRSVIRDIFVGDPGSVHSETVYRNSELSKRLDEQCGQYYLLGDKKYPLNKNLLTPFKDGGQLTPKEMNYNLKLSTNRNVIEHCFGTLKQKFRHLCHIKLRKLTYIIHIIKAACVLHNLAINDEFVLDDTLDEASLPSPHALDLEDEEDDEDAKRIRDKVVNSLKM